MGAFDKQKKEIKRDLQRQRTGLAKAKKLAEALFHQLEGVEGRLSATEEVVNDIPGNEIDTAFRLIRDKKDPSQVKALLQHLAQRVTASPVHQGLATSMKKTRSVRYRPIARTASREAAFSKVVSKVASKLPSKVASAAASKAPSKTTKASSKSGGGRSVKPAGVPSAVSEGGNPNMVEDEEDSNDGMEDMDED